jgi:hypothetical protein
MPPRKKTVPAAATEEVQTELLEKETEAAPPELILEEAPEPIQEVEQETEPAHPELILEEVPEPVQEVEQEPAQAEVPQRTNVIPIEANKKKKRKYNPPAQAESFDLNQVQLAGLITSTWAKRSDVFARLRVGEDKHGVHVTLRIADGMIGDDLVSLQPGDHVEMKGYLIQHEYYESIRKFLEEASASSFLDSVDLADLDSWRKLLFRRRNALVNVLSMRLLAGNKPLAEFGPAAEVRYANRASVEGVVARVWEYPHSGGVDLFARLAVYDEHTRIEPGAEGNFGRPRRQSHFVTVRFLNGKTGVGIPIRLKLKARIRVVGELRDKAQVVSLHEELLGIGLPHIPEIMGRVVNAERMSEIHNVQESLHVVAEACIAYSSSGGSRR